MQKLRRVTLHDVAGVAQAASALCRTAWYLRHRMLPDLLERLGLCDDLPTAPPEGVDQAARWVRWAHRVVPMEPNCLLDSLAAAAVLRAKGYSVPLSIGVKMEDGAFRAHAWLADSAQASAAGFRELYRLHGES